MIDLLLTLHYFFLPLLHATHCAPYKTTKFRIFFSILFLCYCNHTVSLALWNWKPTHKSHFYLYKTMMMCIEKLKLLLIIVCWLLSYTSNITIFPLYLSIHFPTILLILHHSPTPPFLPFLHVVQIYYEQGRSRRKIIKSIK